MRRSSHPSDARLDATTWCRHLVPAGSVYAFLADHRHQLFPPELFADVARQGGGHPSVPAEVIATVMVLQVQTSPLAPQPGRSQLSTAPL